MNEVFEAATGEIHIQDDGAPDRNEFSEYTEYLEACHEPALGEFASAIKAVDDAASGLDVNDYPALGMHRPTDEDDRDAILEGVGELVESSSGITR